MQAWRATISMRMRDNQDENPGWVSVRAQPEQDPTQEWVSFETFLTGRDRPGRIWLHRRSDDFDRLPDHRSAEEIVHDITY